MKKIYTYISLFVLLFPFAVANAQTGTNNNISVDNVNVTRENGMVTVNMDVNLSALKLRSQEMVVVTPVIVSRDNMDMHEFNPFVVTGSVRDKALNRSMDFGHIKFEKEPQFIVRNTNKNQTVPLTLSLPYDAWLHNSRLEFHNNLTGCACENLGKDNNIVFAPVLPSPPSLQIAYITPPAEQVKQRSETYTARLNFELNKYQLLRNYKNNASVLAEVDKIINEIRGDENLTVSEFMITGYASPEGNPQSNMTLSKNRAESFVKYLVETYNISPGNIRTDWKGEDWEGLKKIVSEINIQDKDQILSILDETDVMTRKRRLQQLSGGVPYRKLLQEYYPSLRRNDYTISYVSRNFDVSEAREVIKTKPNHLSQNEMYLVANSYPRDSKEFKEVFDIINRYYPESDAAQLNTAAYDLETGSIETAIMKLQRINTPEAWNNLGVAYYRKNDFEQARTYFTRAAQSGLQTAVQNLNELNK